MSAQTVSPNARAAGPTREKRRRDLPALLAAAACAAVLAGCASSTGSTRPRDESAAAEEVQPLPPGIKPLTVEQEEDVAAAP